MDTKFGAVLQCKALFCAKSPFYTIEKDLMILNPSLSRIANLKFVYKQPIKINVMASWFSLNEASSKASQAPLTNLYIKRKKISDIKIHFTCYLIDKYTINSTKIPLTFRNWASISSFRKFSTDVNFIFFFIYLKISIKVF